MPHASSRIDLLVVPVDSRRAVDERAVMQLFGRWSLNERGRGPTMSSIVDGGCERIWLDRPGRIVLYANQTGGFRVRCPDKGINISAEFGRSHREWKCGGPGLVDCPCGTRHDLEACVLQPPGAFASWAIVFASTEGLALTDQAARDVREALGPYRVVLRRP